jgi:hypothetical protein
MEGWAGSEKARRVVLGAGELRNAELRNGMMGSALQHEPAG